jgi:hypothetical protein
MRKISISEYSIENKRTGFESYFNGLVIALSLSILVACTTPAPAPVPERLPVAPPVQLVKIQKRFDGAAGTIQQDFTHAASMCKREVGSSGLVIGSNVIGSCATFTSCMARKAFYASPIGKFDPEELGLELPCYID